MAQNKKLNPELVAFVSGIAKYIDETDLKAAANKNGMKKNLISNDNLTQRVPLANTKNTLKIGEEQNENKQ